MQYNTAFTYPTWDKSYVKMLRVMVSKTPCTWQDIVDGMHRLNAVPCKDVLKGFMIAHAVAEVGKDGRKKLYALTDKGKSIYQQALSTKEVIEWLEFAAKYKTWLEFKVNAMLFGRADWCELAFYKQHFEPLICAANGTLQRSLYAKLCKLRFFKEYACAIEDLCDAEAVS